MTTYPDMGLEHLSLAKTRKARSGPCIRSDGKAVGTVKELGNLRGDAPRAEAGETHNSPGSQTGNM